MCCDLTDLSDEQLRELEEYLYDAEVEGQDTWTRRDQILWEMNRRGLMERDNGKNNP